MIHGQEHGFDPRDQIDVAEVTPDRPRRPRRDAHRLDDAERREEQVLVRLRDMAIKRIRYREAFLLQHDPHERPTPSPAPLRIVEASEAPPLPRAAEHPRRVFASLVPDPREAL